MIEAYKKLDARLVKAGFPPTSQWWLDTLARFYASGKRQCVLRVGRRGGKSSTLCRVAVCEALAGEHTIPPGDIGIVGIVSVSREEAAKRLRTIEAILRALNVEFKPLREGNGIELVDKPIGFQVFTASISGVSGPTLICCICDEAAKWADKDSGANPASEVLASARPTLATMPNAKLFLSSSPLSTLDAHAKAFDEGETDFQCVAHAETWVANPSPETTEAECHKLEKNPKLFLREFAAQPQSASGACWEAEDIAAAFQPLGEHTHMSTGVLVIDPSSMRSDCFTWGHFSWAHAAKSEVEFYRPDPREPLYDDRVVWKKTGPSKLVLRNLGTFDPAVKRYTADEICSLLATYAKKNGIALVISDQREQWSLDSHFFAHRLRFVPITWDNANKIAAVSQISSWFESRSLVLPEHAKLRAELANFAQVVTPSGAITYRARASGKDDHVSLLMTAAMADMAGILPRNFPWRPKCARVSFPIGFEAI